MSCLAEAVVVVEVQVGRYIWAAAEVFGLRSRVGARIDIGLAGLALRVSLPCFAPAEFAAAVLEFAFAFAGLDAGF